MNRVFNIILSITFLSCQSESDRLVGHWHSIPNKNGTYVTLDVNDSLLSLNKLAVTGWSQENKRTKNEVFLYPLLLEPTSEILIQNDTLIINREIEFVRIKNHLLLKDHYNYSRVSINLPKATKKSFPKNKLTNKHLSAILLGTKKLSSDDSIYMQVNDVFIQYSDLPKYASIEFDKRNQEKFNLVIHADSTISASRIDRIEQVLKRRSLIDKILLARYNYKLNRMEYEIKMTGNKI